MKDLVIGFVHTAQVILQRLTLEPLTKLYWFASQALPRKLPETKEELDQLKSILTQFFGLEDEPAVWATVCGQITSTEATSVRKSYRSMVNAAKRLRINLIANNEKVIAYAALKRRLEETTLKVVNELKKEEENGAVVPGGTSGISGEVSAMPEPS